MQILIALFRQVDWSPVTWNLVSVGSNVKVDHETWPSRDSDGSYDMPVVLGLVTLTVADGAWRAECVHPGDGEPIVVGGWASRDEAVTALGDAVVKPWLGRTY